MEEFAGERVWKISKREWKNVVYSCIPFSDIKILGSRAHMFCINVCDTKASSLKDIC